VPLTEANHIAAAVREQHVSLGSLAERLEQRPRERGWSTLENAGIPLRFVGVLLDALIVFFPLVLVVGLMTGGGYTERGDGYANAGVNIGGNTFWLLLALGVGYYIVCEAAAGATLGKRMVGIRVVGEDGEHVTFGAAVVRNLLRIVDALFFYLIGFLFALTSTPWGGVFTATGQKKGIVNRETRSGSGPVVRICSLYGPSARTPEMVCACPSTTASAPTICCM
jgi:uncharacterized RDD family membrane protein YckC